MFTRLFSCLFQTVLRDLISEQEKILFGLNESLLAFEFSSLSTSYN